MHENQKNILLMMRLNSRIQEIDIKRAKGLVSHGLDEEKMVVMNWIVWEAGI